MNYKLVNTEKEFKNNSENDNLILFDEGEAKLIIKDGKSIKYYRIIETNKDFKVKIRASSLNKCIENATKEELYAMMPDIPQYKINLIYGYLHKKPYVSYSDYAYNNYIAEVTLYRYLKLIKETYLKRLK